MKRYDIIPINDLAVGDRFCFKSDKRNGIVCQVTNKRGYLTTYKKLGTEHKSFSCYTPVIFLRHSANSDGSTLITEGKTPGQKV